jgi:hypothetical protein
MATDQEQMVDSLQAQIEELQNEIELIDSNTYTYNEYNVYESDGSETHPLDEFGYVNEDDYDYNPNSQHGDCNAHIT